MPIRPAQAGDAAALAELLGQLGYPASAETVERRLVRLAGDGDASLWVAVVDGEIAGLVGMRLEHVIEHDRPWCRLTALVVDERHRGRGVGAALTGWVEAEARRLGCESVVLTSGDRREDAHAFYRRLGYRDTGRRFVKSLVD